MSAKIRKKKGDEEPEPEEDEEEEDTNAATTTKDSSYPKTTEVPPGLDVLQGLEKMLVKQELELLEIYCHCEGKNHYSVRDDHGREIMKAGETTCCCWLRCCCCNKTRPFTFTIDDFDGNEIYLDRSLRCNTCFCPCCMNKVRVSMRNGLTIGYVKQRWSLCRSSFNITDGDGTPVLRITGPLWTSSCCCGSVNFKIKDMSGKKLGKISKQWGGIMKEAFTDADTYAISFPADLDVKIKGVLIAAAILIDFMFFENNVKTEPTKT